MWSIWDILILELAQLGEKDSDSKVSIKYLVWVIQEVMVPFEEVLNHLKQCEVENAKFV